MRPKAYEGNEAYIFISYSHKDTELAFQVMNSLQAEGYRLWYDDGIVPGSEWPENIAQHLNNAAMVMALITPNSMESQNCRREINFALAKSKPFLSVVLEPTEMSLGMEMQLSAQHNILRYNYAKWEDFIQKILSCPDIAGCCVTDTKELPCEPESISQKKNEPEPAVILPPVKEPEKKVKKEKPKKEKKQKPPRKGTWKKVLGIGVAVIAAIVLGLFLVNKMTTVQLSTGDTIRKSETYIYLYHDTLTQEDLEAIAGLKQIYHIELEGCDLSTCDFTNISFASEELEYVAFNRCTGVNDFTFLEKMTLNTLSLEGCADFTDLAAIDVSQMISLNLNETGVTDLSCLENTAIETLRFDQTGVSDITALGTMTELYVVSGNNCQVTSIDVLAGLERLNQISFSGCPITQVTVPFQSLRIEKLIFADCGLSDLSGFRDTTMLRVLNIKNNPDITDLDWLDTQNHATLEGLYLGGTGLTADQIGFISSCPEIIHLDINGIAMEDLSVCRGKHNLMTLYAAGCGLTDISALADCESLQDVILCFNSIEDVTPLTVMMQQDYPSIDLSYNAVTDISCLQGNMDSLLLHGNGEKVIDTMQEGLDTFYISADWYEGIENSNLGKSGNSLYIYLLDCPNNQKLNIEDKITGTYLEFISADQLYDLIRQGIIFEEDGLDYSYCLNLYDAMQ